jgi:aspartyl protease family protein
MVLLALVSSGAAAAEGLQGRLEALAASEGFAVSGLERLAEAPAKFAAPAPTGTPLSKRIGALLEGYNYVLLYDSGGRITELMISGRAPAIAPAPVRGSIATTRRGPHYVVESELTGPNGAKHNVPLLLDTGATTVVLPQSMIEPLGFEVGDLTDGWSQTAAGRVPIKRGHLESIKVGRMVEGRVAVSFVEDDKLGNQTLLGMSFLDRFRLTIDDQHDRIILMRK